MLRAIPVLLLMLGFASPAAAGCEPIAEQGRDYVVCTFDASRDAIRLFWKNGDGRPYGSPTGVATALPWTSTSRSQPAPTSQVKVPPSTTHGPATR